MTTVTTENKRFEDNTFLLVLELAQLRTLRTASMEDVTVEADKSMLRLGQTIVDSDELRAIEGFDRDTKSWLLRRSNRPRWLKGGVYMIAAEALEDCYNYLTKRQKERTALVMKFKVAYPDLVNDAKKRLKDLFDPSQYPPVHRITHEFNMDFSVAAFGPPQGKLKAVSEAILKKEMTKHQKRVESSIDDINAGLTTGLQTLVTTLADRLGEGESGKPRRLRADAFDKLSEWLELFSVRNVTNNDELAKLAANARKLISGVKPEELKKDEKGREQMQGAFAGIAKQLEGMIEDKPTRAIARGDDEV